MARRADPEREEIWGTWEELLLACAVSRHGTRRWGSVAMEIQSRIPPSNRLTAQSCRQRYLDLQLRFAARNGAGEDDSWVEELRKLRVEELRREVERCDISIGSLQLKVRSLQEEREKIQSGDRTPDRLEEEEDDVAGDEVSGRGSSFSCGESNSIDLKQGDREPINADYRKKEEADRTGGEATNLAIVGGKKAVGEASYKGSTEGGAAKESSDVQSSANLSRFKRRRLRRKEVSFDGSSSGVAEAEAEVEEGRIMSSDESQPLVSLLNNFRSDRNSSVFERRLSSQESIRYRSLIRRHVDLEMVRSKLGQVGFSGESYTPAEFFRDLLVICNNAIVFYPKFSPEFNSAVHLRQLVSSTFRTPPPLLMETTLQSPPTRPKATASKTDTGPAVTGPLSVKSTSSAPLIACRKRSSTPNKATVNAAKENDEKSESDLEKGIVKKSATKERHVLSVTTRGLRSNKSRVGSGNAAGVAKRPRLAPSQSLKNRPTENYLGGGEVAVKADKKSDGGAATGSTTEKQSAASFLNRMKGSSKRALMEKLKSSSSGVGSRKTEDQSKGGKGEGRRDQNSRQGTGGRGTKKAEDTSVPEKRRIGRPPKRPAPPSTPPPAKSAKGEKDAPPSSKSPFSSSSRKRGRR